jgi:Tol biopolymer transport system component
MRLMPVVIATLLCAAQSMAPAAHAAPQGKIAYMWARESRFQEVWTMNADGSDRTFVVEGSVPAWAPDGRRIAFVAKGGGIHTVRPDGSDLRLLLDLPGAEARMDWSPDGTRIAFAYYANPDRPWFDSDIYVVNADGSDPRNLTNQPDGQHGEPSWSPDSERIAFSGRTDGPVFTIHVMDADGQNIEAVGPNEGQSFTPEWSPNGGRIAYNHRLPDETGADIHLLRLSDRSITQLTEVEGVDGTTQELAWSPDGAYIAYGYRHQPPDQPGWPPDTYAVRVATGTTFTLTNDGQSEEPSWVGASPFSVSPDGKTTTTWGRIKAPE